MDMGAEGYGIYFMIIEKLLESSDYILVKDYNVIAFDLRVGSDKIKAVIENFGLFHFTEDGKRFYSESLLRRMKPLDNLRKQRSEAGKKSAESRKSNDRSTTVEEKSNKTPFLLGENSTKESKVNVLLEKEPKMYIGDFSKNSENDFSKNENPNPELKAENKKRQTEGGGGENSKHGGCTENSHRNSEILNEHAEVEQMYVESKKEPKKARFCKPTLSEVQEYCYARQNLVDAERFYNYYESNGWKVGKNPMKDWKACVRTWERNGYDTKTNVNQYGTNTDANNEPKFGRMPASEVAKSISGWGECTLIF